MLALEGGRWRFLCLDVVSVLAALALPGCEPIQAVPRLRVVNGATSQPVQFCLRPADAEAFARIPSSSRSDSSYSRGTLSAPLRLEAGPKIFRVVRRGEDCTTGSPLAPDFAVDLVPGTATRVVLAPDPLQWRVDRMSTFADESTAALRDLRREAAAGALVSTP